MFIFCLYVILIVGIWVGFVFRFIFGGVDFNIELIIFVVFVGCVIVIGFM